MGLGDMDNYLNLNKIKRGLPHMAHFLRHRPGMVFAGTFVALCKSSTNLRCQNTGLKEWWEYPILYHSKLI